MDFIYKLLIAGATMGLLNGLWLGLVAINLYRSELGKLMLEKPNMVAALIFYAIYIFGVIIFVLNPALAKGSLKHALLYGALFGLVAYATFDLTNFAVLNFMTVFINEQRRINNGK